MCEKCNLLYCGSCALSSNGKCPKCGNVLRSPESVMSYDVFKSEIYRGKGQPRLLEALSALYIEPERAMKTLREYSSLFTAAINITILYLLVTFLRIVLLVIILSGMFVVSPTGPAPTPLGTTVFEFIITTLLYYGVLIFGWLLASLLYWLPSKLLGGKGEFVQQASLLSYILLNLFPLQIFSMMLLAVPAFGAFLSSAGAIVVFFYSTFLIFMSIREINEFSNPKALVSFAISTAVFIGIGVALSVLLALLVLLHIGNIPYPSV